MKKATLPPVTDWFDHVTRPWEPGVYQRRLTLKSRRAPVVILWSYWTGNNWMAGTLTRSMAHKQRDVSLHDKLPWRGLRSPA